ncbi:MAG TPA: hypothetical protein VIJ75_03290 [Hanamia sp.]
MLFINRKLILWSIVVALGGFLFDFEFEEKLIKEKIPVANTKLFIS